MSERLSLPQPDDRRNFEQVYLKLPHREYQRLISAYEAAGEPEPNRHLGHNNSFAAFLRGCVLGRVELGSGVPEPEPAENRYGDVPLSLTAETLNSLSRNVDDSDLPERYRQNGPDARRVRYRLREWLEGQT